MADYTQTTFFTVKDGLASGNPLKLIKGSEFDGEYDAISTAIGTKVDTAGDGIDITDKTISLSLSGLTSATIATTDSVAFGDQSDSGNPKKTTVADLVDVIATGGTTGIDHTSGVLRVDPTAATAATMAADDAILIADASDAGALKKANPSDVAAIISGGTGYGVIEVDDKLALDFDNLGISGLIDTANDRIAIYDDSAAAHYKISPDDFINEVIDDVDAIETDEQLSVDYLLFYNAQTGEVGKMYRYNEGKLVDSSFTHLATLQDTDGNKNCLNDTAGIVWLYLPTASGLPVGWQTTFINRSTADTMGIFPTGTDTLTSTLRSGTTTAGAVTVDAGGMAHVVKTASGKFNITGDIS